ncbi:MAG: type II toxin-antitoxin system Phd/YefM family antitoxin [Acidobacteriota bacterium]
MTVFNATQARAKLYKLIETVCETHEPVQITSKKGNAVLVSEDDWRAVQETLHLLSVPGMRESIQGGLETPIEECSEDPGW